MQASLQKLQKFFKLEAELGYTNRAVIGGFERMASSWEAEARLEALPEDLIQAVTDRLRDYPRLTPQSRQEALQGLWRRVTRSLGEKPGGEAEAPLPPAPRPAPPPASAAPLEARPAAPPTAPRQAPPAPPAEPAPLPPRRVPKEPPAALNAPVSVLPGVGPKHGQTLERLGLKTLGDMLYYFPRRYLDFSQLKPINRLLYGEEVTVIGTVESVALRKASGGRMQIVEALIGDGSGVLRLTWFNQPWIAQRLHNRPPISVSGKVEQYLGRLVINNPEWEPLEQQQLHTNRIVPVYALTARITQRWLRNLLNEVVAFWAPRVLDPLPEETRAQAGLPDLTTALQQVHFPDSWETLKAARQRLAFDEIFLLQLGVLSQKRDWQSRSGRVFEIPDEWLEAQLQRLPYQLTGAQQVALADLRADLASGRPMNRLLQGDVGSGKTVVAALAIAAATREGAQAAIMAPTSILAEQHFRNLHSLLCGEGGPLAPEQVGLLIGATPEGEKAALRQGLAEGSLRLVVGTHALLEDPVQFNDLALVVIDEQHRFGVEQRAILRQKGASPHLLVMTATPIPRSLALTVYGDLDLSLMDELPPGRQEIETAVLLPRERERAYALINSQVAQGRQAFIIYPLVEESEKSEAMAAVEEHARLQERIFPRLRLGLLHGRLRPDEKDGVMARFRDGEYQVLVSTSVVEVGVDVPNATVMLIEGANRFGLAQLHQFRGRVGRGEQKSFCLLVPDSPDAAENERLAALAETNDGFKLAEIDLQQRGPGDFLGVRQSGFGDLRLASLTDVHLIEKARRLAQELFARDPDLSQEADLPLAQAMKRFWRAAGSADPS
jgi:ATP-dependent DNA helicase RecG